MNFTVFYLKDVEYTEVYKGKLVRVEGEDEILYVGDFSDDRLNIDRRI